VLRLLIQFLKIIVIMVVALVIIAGARQLYEDLAQPSRQAPNVVTVKVKPGDSATEISRTLEDAKVIRPGSGIIFRTLVRLRNVGGKFTAGDHQIIRGMSMNQIIDVLTTPPKIDEVTVTFPEGMRIEEYATRLKESGVIDNEDAFVQATKESYDFDFLRFRPSGVGLEGYLFPDTYRFVRGSKPRDIITRMLQNFDRQLTPEMRAQAEAQRRTIHQIVTLASIIEKEAQKPEERPTVAGVYVNRLDRDMPLQADPTVQYVIGTPGNWWPKDNVVLADALKKPGPYNTYLTPGLPPGPIANPGLASLKAALNPEKHDYLYFVAKGDGYHAFARTLDEHNANVRQFNP
jgi:UPF0755 protein